jgi:hypothetical protein
VIGFSWVVVGQGVFNWFFIGLEETTQKGDGSLSLPVSVLLWEAVVTYCLVSGVGLLWRLCLLAYRVLGFYDPPALLCTGYVHDGSGTERKPTFGIYCMCVFMYAVYIVLELSVTCICVGMCGTEHGCSNRARM